MCLTVKPSNEAVNHPPTWRPEDPTTTCPRITQSDKKVIGHLWLMEWSLIWQPDGDTYRRRHSNRSSFVASFLRSDANNSNGGRNARMIAKIIARLLL